MQTMACRWSGCLGSVFVCHCRGLALSLTPWSPAPCCTPGSPHAWLSLGPGPKVSRNHPQHALGRSTLPSLPRVAADPGAPCLKADYCGRGHINALLFSYYPFSFLGITQPRFPLAVWPTARGLPLPASPGSIRHGTGGITSAGWMVCSVAQAVSQVQQWPQGINSHALGSRSSFLKHKLR